MVVISPNVDFDESSVSRSTTSHGQSLNNLSHALDGERRTHEREAQDSKVEEQPEDAAGLMSEWESDEDNLRLKATEDERMPNGIGPGVPLVPREPDPPTRRHRRSEVERLADGAGAPPTHEKRRPKAAIGTAMECKDGGSHHASVGVAEIEEKKAENARKFAYYKALLAAENEHLHNEPVDVKEAKERTDWAKWKSVMQEELDSLK